MNLDYSEKKKLKIDMTDYVKGGVLDSFPIKFREGETATAQAGEDLFGQKSNNDKKLYKDMTNRSISYNHGTRIVPY